jgi:AcrR family transcriptional regulator
VAAPGAPPVPRRRTGGRSARVRAAVLGAALDELVERGCAGMTVQGVATRAAVNKTSVYRRWGTKAALLADALLSSAGVVVPPDTGALRTDLFALWRTAPRGRERGDLSRTVAVSRALTASPDPEVAEVHRLLWQQRLELVHTAVDRAVARRELPAGADPELLLDLLVGPFQSRVISRGAQPDPVFFAHVMEAAVRAVGARPIQAPVAVAQKQALPLRSRSRREARPAVPGGDSPPAGA